MIGAVWSWLTGGVLDRLISAYAKAKDAGTERERIKAGVLEAQIAAEVEARKVAATIRTATAGHWEMRLITALTGAPFVLHLNLVALDTCFGFGWRVAAFPPPFNEWQGAILLSLFGLAAAGKGITAIAAAWIARR